MVECCKWSYNSDYVEGALRFHEETCNIRFPQLTLYVLIAPFVQCQDNLHLALTLHECLIKAKGMLWLFCSYLSEMLWLVSTTSSLYPNSSIHFTLYRIVHFLIFSNHPFLSMNCFSPHPKTLHYGSITTMPSTSPHCDWYFGIILPLCSQLYHTYFLLHIG